MLFLQDREEHKINMEIKISKNKGLSPTVQSISNIYLTPIFNVLQEIVQAKKRKRMGVSRVGDWFSWVKTGVE
jgi:hypothetical protein